MISFVNQIGLYSLLGLLILILLYLFARKPRKKTFPSLIFFMRNEKTKRKTSFLRYFMANFLFFLQFLAILLLALSAASLLVDLPKSMTEQKHSINVIDTSASMQADYKSSTRFQTALKNAQTDKKHASIILAQKPPATILERGSSERANSILNSLHPSENPTKVGESMLQALTLSKGTVNVYSDFSNVDKPDIKTARQKLLSEGYEVKFHTFNEKKDNVGIVGAEIETDSATIKIKNYANKNQNIEIQSPKENKSFSIQKRGFKSIEMPLKIGENEITINTDDDLKADNKAFISVPKRDKIKTLYITSKEEDPYLKSALESIGRLDIKYSSPPIANVEGYDLYIIKDINKDKVLPTTFNLINKEVKNGASLLLHLQPSSLAVDYKELTTLGGVENEPTYTIKRIKNEVTSGINFGNVNRHFTLNDECEGWVTTPQNHSIICYSKEGKGNKLIYGIMESDSDFKNRPDYPIFWKNVIYKFFDINNKEKLNYKTGNILPARGKVETPLGETSGNKVLLDKQGFYKLNDKTIAANLFDYKESDINDKNEFEDLKTTQESQIQKDNKRDITIYAILAALILILTELIIIKWRGDI